MSLADPTKTLTNCNYIPLEVGPEVAIAQVVGTKLTTDDAAERRVTMAKHFRIHPLCVSGGVEVKVPMMDDCSVPFPVVIDFGEGIVALTREGALHLAQALIMRVGRVHAVEEVEE